MGTYLTIIFIQRIFNQYSTDIPSQHFSQKVTLLDYARNPQNPEQILSANMTPKKIPPTYK